MKTLLWKNLGPLSLIGLALILNLSVALRPNPVIDLGPIDLASGTAKRATFRPGYAGTYAIGVRLDQATAERLYPCMVSVEAMQKPECKRLGSSWPVALALKVSLEGRDLAGEVTPTTSLAGGEYDGAGNYTWAAAHIRLVPGKPYHLEVRSIRPTSALESAEPRLVVSAAGAPGLAEGNALREVVVLFAGILLIASAAVWALANSRSHRLTVAKTV